MTVTVLLIIGGVLSLLLGISSGLERKKQSRVASVESAPQKNLSFTTVFWIYVALVLAGAAGWLVSSYLAGDAAARVKLIDDLRKMLILLVIMTAGMLASVLVGHIQKGKKVVSIENIMLPLTCSFLVFNSVWAGLSDRSIGAIELLAAFESGFGWESFLNRFIKSGSSTTKTSTAKASKANTTAKKAGATKTVAT
jgi:hypothetical protein